MNELNEQDAAHLRMSKETHRMLNFILGPALFTEAVHKKPALLHINPIEEFVRWPASGNY